MMARYVLRRTLGALIAIFGASLIAFAFLRLAPGNPAKLILGQFATPQALEELTRRLGLDDPFYVQYGHFVWSFVTGDWGFSYSAGVPISQAIGDKLPATIELGLFAFAFAFLGAIGLALLATYRHRPRLDAAIRAFASFGLGLPQFWLGLLLLLVLSEQLGLFPGPDGRLSPDVEAPPTITHLLTVDALLSGHPGTFVNALWHLILPGATLGLMSLAFLTRLLRVNLLDVAHEPFLLVVRGKGLSRWAAFTRHALPNAILPTLTASGMLLGQLIAGSVLVETVFRWPGVGLLVTQGVLRQDYSVVQIFILLSAVVYVASSLLVDLLVAWIDPRVRVQETRR